MVISLGYMSPCSSSSLPGAFASCETGRRAISRPTDVGYTPAWPCSRWGLPGRPHYCERRWSFTQQSSHDCPRLFTMTEGREPKFENSSITTPYSLLSIPGCLFLWPDPVSNLSYSSPHSGGYPAPCSMEYGLSSTLSCRAATIWPACGEFMILRSRVDVKFNFPEIETLPGSCGVALDRSTSIM